MVNHYDQFVAMLGNAQRMRPVVFRRKSVNLTTDSIYKVVEMESSAGKILFGFNKITGELMDVIGPCLLPARIEPSRRRVSDEELLALSK